MNKKIATVALVFAAATMSAAELNTRAYLESRPDWQRLNEKAVSLAKKNMEQLEGWKTQMTCMPGVGIIWQWDSCYMALYGGYTPGNYNGLGNLDNLYTMQGEDGYISMAYTYETRKPTWAGRINPPLYAWCEWLYAQRTGDLTRLPKAYEACSKYYRWLKANRTRKNNGLYYFEDTGSSGMDNSPRSGYFAEHQKGSDVCFVDLCCQQVLAARCLAKMAPYVGKADEAKAWNHEADHLAEKINDLMWCERTGFYHDLYINTNNKLAVKTAAAFWALVSGVATPDRAAKLAAHLTNENTFGSKYPVPSLSKDDPNYDPYGGYWLGGVWPPIVYMTCRGLRENGYGELSREIARKHLDQMCDVLYNYRTKPKSKKFSFASATDEEIGTIWECYAPEFAEPARDKLGKQVRKNFVGWGGLGPIILFIEDIIGLDINALENRIDWRISETGNQGMKNIPFNGGKVSLSAFVPDKRFFSVTVETDRPLRLRVFSADGTHRVVKYIKPGVTKFHSREPSAEHDAPME